MAGGSPQDGTGPAPEASHRQEKATENQQLRFHSVDSSETAGLVCRSEDWAAVEGREDQTLRRQSLLAAEIQTVFLHLLLLLREILYIFRKYYASF